MPPHVVNKIAAGEVIERPASIVKELIENAVDAEARRITVEVEEGGKRLIRVADDGNGIAPDDMPLVMKSHATSKLKDIDELLRIDTLGFRGEALSSIGAVAEVRIVSRQRESAEGCELRVSPGNDEEILPAASDVGTMIEVRGLFLNIPVRKKFLRNVEIEYNHIYEAVMRFAIAYPEIRFDLKRDGVPDFTLPPCKDVRERIGHFMGKELMDALIEAEAASPQCKLKGYLATPPFAKLSLRNQFIYLNGRFIRDRVLTRAVNEAYKEMIPHGRFPTAVLFLEMSPGEVDVNVHPTKIEVRFRNVWRLHDLIIETLRAKLLRSEITPTLTSDQLRGFSSQPTTAAVGARTQEIINYFTNEGPQQYQPALSAPIADASAPAGRDILHGGRRFTQIHDLYIIEETEDGIVIIDQHALHERAMYEELKRLYSSADMPRQRLLIPMVVELSAEERNAIEDARLMLEAMGIEFDDFGHHSAVVRTMPAILKDMDPVSLVKDFVEMWMEKGESRGAGDEALSLIEETLHFMACRSAVKAGRKLVPEEIERLLALRESLEYSQTCVHGRPTSIRISLEELEKLFERRK